MKNKQLTKTNNYARHLALSVLLVFGMFFSVNAQTDIEVSGTVTGAVDGLPIPGVAVIIKGTDIGTATDFDGNYVIGAKLGDILEFSGIGFRTQTQKVTGEKLNIKIEEDVQDLGETVLIGYGRVEKKEVIGAVAQVKAEQIEDFVTADLASALQGQIAGVNINPDGSEPGAPSSITIRGVSSLIGNSNPLFVVDGVPFDEDPNLNPNEIETIDVLKDAASASIYGTRASGGVILITTKKGVEGKNSIELNARVGFQDVPEGDFVERANTVEQIFIDSFSATAANPLSGATATRFSLVNDANILDNVFNDGAIQQDYSLRFFGGSKGVSYSVIGGYFKQEGIVQGSELERYNTRSNIRINKGKWKVNSGFALTIDDRNLLGDNLIQNALNFSPFLADIDELLSPNSEATATLRGGPSTNRAAAIIRSLDSNSFDRRYRISVNNQISYKLSNSISLNNFFGYSISENNRSNSTSSFVLPTLSAASVIQRGSVAEGSLTNITVTWNGGLDYDKDFGKHNVKGTLRGNIEQTESRSFASARQDLVSGAAGNLNNAVGTVATSSTGGLNGFIPNNFVGLDGVVRRLGLIGRIQYNYDKRYLLSVSARRDGSSQFGPDFTYNTFPSVSVGWNISEEQFWEPYSGLINDFKLRASTGTTGNDRFPLFQSQVNATINNIRALFGTVDSPNLQTASVISRLQNLDIQWETTIQSNFGVDLAFLKNAITFSADYYTTRKEDLLLPVRTPLSSGVSVTNNTDFSDTPIVNVGDLKSSGIEYAVNYKGNAGDFKWTVGGTFSSNNNTVESLSGDINIQEVNGPELFNAGGSQRIINLVRGFDPGAFLLFRTDGIIRNQQEADEYNASITAFELPGGIRQVGDVRYVDTNGDGVINQSDREVRGSGLPSYEAGLNLNVGYKGFNLSTSWYGSFGNEVINGARANAFNESRARALIFQFSEQNADTPLPVLDGRGSNNVNFAQNTDLFLEDGSFVRLRNVVLSYKLPKSVLSKLSVADASISVSGQNLVTFTEYSGFDPGVGGNNIGTRGLDRSRFPLARSYNVGLKIKF